jgi:hypothetical protein
VGATAALIYEQFNFGIFGSQLQLVIDLNSAQLPIFHAEAVYRRAAAAEPGFYSSYSFDLWMGWLEKTAKFIQVDNGNTTLTHDGKEFFKYIVNRGYSLVRPH